MEDNKKVYKFYGKPGEDFHLWCARTEAALQAKEVLRVVTVDPVVGDEEPDDETLKAIATARAIVIQGLGDRPLRLCLSERDNPHKMWTRLRDRYAVSNTATRVQLQSKLSRMSYQGQSMPDFVDSYEEIFNRLAAMESVIPEDMQIAMLLASFGDKNQSPYGHIVASLQSVQDSLTWETVTARLLQEYEEVVSRGTGDSLPKLPESGQALAATDSSEQRRKQKSIQHRSKQEKRRCFRCNKVGHIARNCKSKKKSQGGGRRNDDASQYFDAEEGVAQSAQLLLSVSEKKISQTIWGPVST